MAHSQGATNAARVLAYEGVVGEVDVDGGGLCRGLAAGLEEAGVLPVGFENRSIANWSRAYQDELVDAVPQFSGQAQERRLAHPASGRCSCLLDLAGNWILA